MAHSTMEFNVQIFPLSPNLLTEEEEEELDEAEVYFPDEGVWRIEVTRRVGDQEDDLVVTHANEQELVALMDAGLVSASFGIGDAWGISEEEFTELANQFALAGISIPHAENFSPVALIDAAEKVLEKEETDPLFQALSTFHHTMEGLRREQCIILNHADHTGDSVLEEVEVYCNWARARLQSALATETERGDWERLLAVREGTVSRHEAPSHDGVRRESSYTERTSACYLARVPLAWIAEWALDGEEVEKMSDFFYLDAYHWNMRQEEAREFFPSIVEKLIKFFDQAEEDVLTAVVEGHIK